MKKLIFALNEFLLSFDEDDFYSCELKNNKVRLFGCYSWGLLHKLTSCGFQWSATSDGYYIWQGVVVVHLVKKYATDGHAK